MRRGNFEIPEWVSREVDADGQRVRAGRYLPSGADVCCHAGLGWAGLGRVRLVFLRGPNRSPLTRPTD